MTNRDDLTIVQTPGRDAAKVEALDRLAGSDDPEVLQVLLALAQDQSLGQAIGIAVGNAVGQIYWRQRRVNDAPFYLFSGPAGEGFDAAVARLDMASPSESDS